MKLFWITGVPYKGENGTINPQFYQQNGPECIELIFTTDMPITYEDLKQNMGIELREIYDRGILDSYLKLLDNLEKVEGLGLYFETDTMTKKQRQDLFEKNLRIPKTFNTEVKKIKKPRGIRFAGDYSGRLYEKKGKGQKKVCGELRTEDILRFFSLEDFKPHFEFLSYLGINEEEIVKYQYVHNTTFCFR